MKTIASCLVNGTYRMKPDNIKWLIVFNVITLSGFHCITKLGTVHYFTFAHITSVIRSKIELHIS
jgi:hypothetical protein